MIYLQKLLPALVSPLAVVAWLLLLSLFVKARWPCVLALLVLLIASNRLVAQQAMSYLEKDHPPITLANAPNVDAIVVLGGMTRTIQRPDGTVLYEFTDRVDRLNAGITLMTLGKADTLIFTRGTAPWSVGIPEGEYLRAIAFERGIESTRIRLTGDVLNTADEAREIAKMMTDGQRIALVTSAFHMPRAATLFEKQGVDFVPVPVDFLTEVTRFKPTDLIPDSEAVWQTSLFVREMIGRAYYALKR